MRKIVFALLALGSILTTDAMATPTVGNVPSQAAIKQSQVEQIYYRRWYGPRYRYGFYGGPGYRYGGGYCYRWRRICADRWGWGGPGFRRCLWRHGC